MVSELDKKMEDLGFELVGEGQPGLYRRRPEKAAEVMALFAKESACNRDQRLQEAKKKLLKAIPMYDLGPLPDPEVHEPEEVSDESLERQPLDLSNQDLSGAKLGGANLSGANLIKADFCLANLSGAVLRIANLVEARLSGTTVERARFGSAERFSPNQVEDLLDRGAVFDDRGQQKSPSPY